MVQILGVGASGCHGLFVPPNMAPQSLNLRTCSVYIRTEVLAIRREPDLQIHISMRRVPRQIKVQNLNLYKAQEYRIRVFIGMWPDIKSK